MADPVFQEQTEESSAANVPKFGMNNEEEPDRQVLAKEVVEYEEYYRNKLVTPYSNIVRYNKLFLNELKDKRRKDELWRAHVPQPYPWSTIKVMAAAYNDMIFGQTPTIRPHAISSRNELAAQNIERLFSYIFRRLKFQPETKRSTEETGIQGVSLRKTVLVEKKMTAFIHPEEHKQAEFQEAIANALEQNVEVPPLDDREGFERWRQLANEELGLGIPELPIPDPMTIRNYFGPSYNHVNIFDTSFDPTIYDPDEQPIIIQRSLKPRTWLFDRTGTEDDKIFDPVAVNEALGSSTSGNDSGEDKVTKWQSEILQTYGISSNTESHPGMKGAVEILEAWYPDAKKFQYRVVLNRSRVINKNMDNPYPFRHPYIFMRNNTVSGHALGISEFKVVERLFYQMNTLAGLRMDALLLSVMPMFVRGREGKSSQSESFMRPGRVVTSNQPQTLRQLVQMGMDPSVFKEDSEIRNQINDATGTTPSLRGATAAPRVPSGNVQKAFESSFTRVKDRILEFEGEINPFITNSLAIMFKFWPSERIVKVGGDPRMNPLVSYKTQDFLDAIEADYAFQGARTAFDNEALIQQSKEWFTILGSVSELLPTYKMDVHAQQISRLILKERADEIFMNEEEIAQAQQAEEEAANEEEAQEGGEGEEQQEAQGPPEEEA